MQLAELLALFSTIAVVIGVAFAGWELRLSRRQRAHEAELLLARSFQTPEFMRALDLVVDLPEELTKAKVEALHADDQRSVGYWLGAMESVGVLVHKGELRIDLVEDFMSGPIVVSWRKLAPYVEARRRSMQRDTMHEWFQWLAERIAAREKGRKPVPANVEFGEPAE
jgi:hypothetical protein